MASKEKAPSASTPPVRQDGDGAVEVDTAKQAAADEAALMEAANRVPSIRDHAARHNLAAWQIATVVARMTGTHDEDGKRVYPDGVDLNTRLSEKDFDAALHIALYGRV